MLEIAVGAAFAPTRFFSVRTSIRDLAPDGESSARNSGIGGGGQHLILTSDLLKPGCANSGAFGAC